MSTTNFETAWVVVPLAIFFGIALVVGWGSALIRRSYLRQLSRPGGPSASIRNLEMIRRYIAREPVEPVEPTATEGRRP